MAFSNLTVPRRPAWDDQTTAEELNRREKESFLDWRRQLAMMEEASESRSMTPFEKNLEVWRQLWRVMERSHIIIQIVDARNPLFYRSEDLEAYAKEIDSRKQMIVLVNKADFLTPQQREIWHQYFKEREVMHFFFSAKNSQKKLDEEAKRRRRERDLGLEEADDSGEEGEESEEEDLEGEEAEDDIEILSSGNFESRILNRDELIEQLNQMAKEMRTSDLDFYDEESRVNVGMVGFPNVGKSSLINVLLGASAHSHGGHRVGVASTPGKTKHFQTLILSDEVLLCDCPGLVFPSFVSSKAEMICSGVLPINQLRDHIAPVAVMCSRVPRHVFETVYRIKIVEEGEDAEDKPVNPRSLLQAYSRARGFWTGGSGLPDESRAARIILKDFVDGRIIYAQPPSSCPSPFSQEEFEEAFNPLLTASAWYGERWKKDEDERASPSVEHLSVAGKGQSAHGPSKKKKGRKGRAGRNPTPYAEGDGISSSSAAYGVKVAGKQRGSKLRGEKDSAPVFSRPVYPHHQTYSRALNKQ